MKLLETTVYFSKESARKAAAQARRKIFAQQQRVEVHASEIVLPKLACSLPVWVVVRRERAEA